MTQAQCKKLFQGASNEKTVYSRLARYGLNYEDRRAAGDCDYFNVVIRCDYGTIRIYKPRRGVMVLQEQRPVTMNYSGIPTFFSTDSVF